MPWGERISDSIQDMKPILHPSSNFENETNQGMFFTGASTEAEEKKFHGAKTSRHFTTKMQLTFIIHLNSHKNVSGRTDRAL